MDAVSYSLASKQAQRIEKFIENPDSTSGIVTVPKTIASGETVTIPAGRVAVLPNVTVDGTLNIENGGEVFIPSGATLGDLDAQLALKAPLVNPAFTNPTATTQTAQDNSTKVATTAYVDGKMVLGTAVNTTSGTSIDFTGIPIWVKKITIMFSGVSLNGASNFLIQIGQTTVETSGYSSSSSYVSNATPSIINSSAGFVIQAGSIAGSLTSGCLTIFNMSGNEYVASGVFYGTGGTSTMPSAGSKTTTNIIDRVRITTVNGTDTFDAGQINIMYEG